MCEASFEIFILKISKHHTFIHDKITFCSINLLLNRFSINYICKWLHGVVSFVIQAEYEYPYGRTFPSDELHSTSTVVKFIYDRYSVQSGSLKITVTPNIPQTTGDFSCYNIKV